MQQRKVSTAGSRIGGRVLAGVASVLASILLAGCNKGVLDPEGPIASAEKTILLNSLAIMLAVVIPTILAIFGVAWWFRASHKQARYRPDWTYSGQVELVVWAIPSMVVILLGGIAWISSHALEPSKPIASPLPPVEIEVVSLDWKWLFIYPDKGIASVNRLVVPTGVPLSFRLTSQTVMNSFFVPQLGSQIYTMAGMKTRLNLLADRPGKYRGFSAQFSGEGFSDMVFSVEALPQDEFDGWVEKARKDGETLNLKSYEALAKPSKAVAPFGYKMVVPGLFDAIVALRMWQTDAVPQSSPAAELPLSEGSLCSAN